MAREHGCSQSPCKAANTLQALGDHAGCLTCSQAVLDIFCMALPQHDVDTDLQVPFCHLQQHLSGMVGRHAATNELDICNRQKFPSFDWRIMTG